MKRMFRWTVSDPLVDHAIDRGRIPSESVLPAFGDFPWGAMLAKMEGAREEEIHFPPSVGFTNLEDSHSLEIVIADDEKEPLFHLFYDETADESSRLQLLDQTPENTTEILIKFVDGDYSRVRAYFEAADESFSREQKPWWKFWE